MEEIYLKARAKINLNLEVLGKRNDNYHQIKSVFQKVNLYDEVFIKKTNVDGCCLQTNILEINNNDNIIYKAYKKLKEQYNQISGVEVLLNKRIPMQAGLAGGSADCSSFILGMNKLFDLNLSKSEIENIGRDLGADVVPCFYDRAVMAYGVGDRIVEIITNFKYYILIIKPKISCNTKLMYQELDSKKNIIQPDASNKIVEALENNNIQLLANNLYNVFENVVQSKNIIQNLKNVLIKNGAIGTLMTGSCSCVYGIFKNKEEAKYAYNVLNQKYEVYITTSYNSLKGKKYNE